MLVFFEPKKIVFEPDLLANSRNHIETLVRVNSRLGVSTSAPSDDNGGNAQASTAASASPSASAAASASATVANTSSAAAASS